MESRDVGRGYAPDAPRNSGAVGDVTPTYAPARPRAPRTNGESGRRSGLRPRRPTQIRSRRGCNPDLRGQRFLQRSLYDADVRDQHRVVVEQHPRSEEHTSELQSLMRISYAVFCLKKIIKTKCLQQPTMPAQSIPRLTDAPLRLTDNQCH